jgi:hypothetical protein
VSLTVNKATPTITWSTPAAITYGTALSATQLNATASIPGIPSVPGAFVYTPASGAVLPVGAQTLTVNFAPTDTADYNPATKSVSLTVNKATPTIAWSTPAAITYGTALSATQLNATASVPGAFVYTPPSGTILNAGAQTLSLNFTPTDTANYNSTTRTLSLTVNQAASPPLTVTASPTIIAYNSSCMLNATGGAGSGAVTYAASGGGSISGSTFTAVAVSGYVTITATQAADANHLPATGTVTVRVMDPNLDSDGDGVTDIVELMLGLDPNNPTDVSVQSLTYDKTNQLNSGPGGRYDNNRDAEGNIKQVSQ